MANPFLQNFDDLLNDILTDYGNLDPQPDTGVGSITYIKAACLASCLWGIYRYQDYLSKQIFPDSADTDNLNHYGSIYGIARPAGTSDSDYANLILSYIQQPPAGGNAKDYYTWALATPSVLANVTENFAPSAVDTTSNYILSTQIWVNDTVSIPSTAVFSTTGTPPTGLTAGVKYYITVVSYDTTAGTSKIRLATTSGGTPVTLASQGTGVHTLTPDTTAKYSVVDAEVLSPGTTTGIEAGTVTVVITPTTGTPIGADETLRRACYAYIEALRPVTASGNSVVLIELIYQGVDVIIHSMRTGVTYTTAIHDQMQVDIANYINSLRASESMTEAALISTCVQDGANSVEITNPVGDITPTVYQAYRAGSITISYIPVP